ncbi:TonB-dependent receptor [Croceicoccus sp. BE223]|uniref:TonB-dependent receptor n=1 Tax=Croceicoccus sp. BE223 TaxID=2817716 RepID=UPI00285630DA|nr:TonB-dependent receptor [Croceicoccus sp. BE223]MDR7101731.1 iron complex outermembrane receptor protein [Croceicoccus sp. BE223]
MNTTKCRSLLLACTIAVMPATAFAQDGGEEEYGFGDIVVTAQRTDQRLQDVPVSVTAITAEEIETRQITAPLDIQRLSPNVKLDGVTGGSAGLKAFIRGGGVTDSAFVLSESEVALYTNDVYNSRLQAALVDFAEIERIEVLRGPQGVLYGRNSSAGAINIITKAPADHLTGTVQAGYGSWNERRLKGYVSVPLSASGDWAFSLNGMIRGRDGGKWYNATLDRKVGEEDFAGGQFDLGYKGEALTARLNVFYLDLESDGLFASNTTVESGEIVPISGDYRTVLSPDMSSTKVKQWGSSLNLAYDFGGGTLKSITGYSDLDDSWFIDFSGGVPGSYIAFIPGIDPDAYYALFERGAVSDQWQFTQELQAAGSASIVDYVAGLFYFHESAGQDIDSTIFFAPSKTVFGAKTDAWAAYGQATVNLTDALSVVAGGRYTKEDKSLDATIGGVPAVSDDSWKKFTPKLGVNYKLTPDVLLYASYSEGFKAGGYNGLASTAAQLAVAFKPQITKAYEVGIKGDIGRTVRFGLTVFWNDIVDRQQPISLGDGGFLVENYDVRIQGIEAELAWRPVQGLQIWGNAALNDGKYTDASVENASLINNAPPSLPDYSFTVGVDYRFVLGGGEVKLGGDYGKRDGYYSTPDNAAIGLIEPQESLNAYLGYETGPWNLQVAGKNLTQEEGWQTGFGFSVIQPRFIIEPRTWLATARYSF